MTVLQGNPGQGPKASAFFVQPTPTLWQEPIFARATKETSAERLINPHDAVSARFFSGINFRGMREKNNILRKTTSNRAMPADGKQKRELRSSATVTLLSKCDVRSQELTYLQGVVASASIRVTAA